jgi:hypothetical protein
MLEIGHDMNDDISKITDLIINMRSAPDLYIYDKRCICTMCMYRSIYVEDIHQEICHSMVIIGRPIGSYKKLCYSFPIESNLSKFIILIKENHIKNETSNTQQEEMDVEELDSRYYIIGIVYFIFRYAFDIVFQNIQHDKWFEDISNKNANELVDEFLKGRTKESASYIFVNNSEVSRNRIRDTLRSDYNYKSCDYMASSSVIAHSILRELEHSPESTTKSVYLRKKLNARLLIVLTKFMTILSIHDICEIAQISLQDIPGDCSWICENTLQYVIEECLMFKSTKIPNGNAKIKITIARIEFILSLMLSLQICETTFEEIEEKCFSEALDPTQPILYIPALFMAVIHIAGTKRNYTPLRGASIVTMTVQDETNR